MKRITLCAAGVTSAFLSASTFIVVLWTIGGAIVASTVLRIVWGIFTPRDEGKKDQRDREKVNEAVRWYLSDH